MSADLLRRASEAIRADWAPWPDHSHVDECCHGIKYHAAVAEWLDFMVGRDPYFAPAGYRHALAVARAYLGEQP